MGKGNKQVDHLLSAQQAESMEVFMKTMLCWAGLLRISSTMLRYLIWKEAWLLMIWEISLMSLPHQTSALKLMIMASLRLFVYVTAYRMRCTSLSMAISAYPQCLPLREHISTQIPQQLTCLFSSTVNRLVINYRFSMISCNKFSPSTDLSVPVAISVTQLTISQLPNLYANLRLSVTRQKTTTERSNCTLSLLMPICRYSISCVCWLISTMDCEIGLITCRPGSRTRQNLPHSCKRPKLCICCWKSGFDLHGQHPQNRQEQQTLQGTQQKPTLDRKAGKQQF